jgi:hypothetical protein
LIFHAIGVRLLPEARERPPLIISDQEQANAVLALLAKGEMDLTTKRRPH